MATKRERLSLTYFLVRALFLGFGFSNIFLHSKRDVWIVMILGILLGMLFILMNQYILKNKKNLKELLSEMNNLGLVIRFLMILFASFILLLCLIILQNYLSNFYLINTPLLMLTIPILILVYYITRKGMSVIGRVAECLLPISLILVLISIFSLWTKINLNNFLPILETKISTIIISSLSVGIISAAPTFLISSTNDKGSKMLRIYVLSTLSVLGMGICTTGVLGATMSNIFNFPEYMVLKRITVFNLLEKMENFLAIQWLIDLFVTMAVASSFTYSLLPEKRKDWTLGLILVVILYFSSIIVGGNDVFEVFISKYYFWILLIFIFTTFFVVFINRVILNKKTKT